MNHSEELKHATVRGIRNQAKKRKWREIEMLKERYALLEELKQIDSSQSYALDDLELY